MEANKVLLQKMYTKIIIEFSEQTGKSIEESMDYFYKSTTNNYLREYQHAVITYMLKCVFVLQS